tara:strand:- start:8498 stop:9487 length:990 start_codon:yes stop_codon:yes gene_type:complete
MSNKQKVSDFLNKNLKNKKFNYFDVGARNGSFLLPEDYAKNTIVHAFEPNMEEFKKLKSKSTDAFKKGITEPKFKKKILYNTALYEKKCQMKLFITSGPGAVSLMGPADKIISENLWRKFDKGTNYYLKHQKIKKIETVKCNKIDNLWKKNDFIDFLKLDTEGSELKILRGAQTNLRKKKILMIKTEYLLVPYYKKHYLLGHQQVFLDKFGYRLIYFDNNHYDYSWKESAVDETYDKRFQYAGDAYFIPDPDLNNLDQEQLLRLGIICLAMGFNSSGINFLKKTEFFSKNIFQELESLASKPSKIRYLVNLWKNTPKNIANFLKLGEVN